MPITNLQEKFLHELADIYDAEHRFLEAQQQMLEEASAQELQGMIQHRPYRLDEEGFARAYSVAIRMTPTRWQIW